MMRTPLKSANFASIAPAGLRRAGQAQMERQVGASGLALILAAQAPAYRWIARRWLESAQAGVVGYHLITRHVIASVSLLSRVRASERLSPRTDLTALR